MSSRTVDSFCFFYCRWLFSVWFNIAFLYIIFILSFCAPHCSTCSFIPIRIYSRFILVHCQCCLHNLHICSISNVCILYSKTVLWYNRVGYDEYLRRLSPRQLFILIVLHFDGNFMHTCIHQMIFNLITLHTLIDRCKC